MYKLPKFKIHKPDSKYYTPSFTTPRLLVKYIKSDTRLTDEQRRSMLCMSSNGQTHLGTKLTGWSDGNSEERLLYYTSATSWIGRYLESVDATSRYDKTNIYMNRSNKCSYYILIPYTSVEQFYMYYTDGLLPMWDRTVFEESKEVICIYRRSLLRGPGTVQYTRVDTSKEDTSNMDEPKVQVEPDVDEPITKVCTINSVHYYVEIITNEVPQTIQFKRNNTPPQYIKDFQCTKLPNNQFRLCIIFSELNWIDVRSGGYKYTLECSNDFNINMIIDTTQTVPYNNVTHSYVL